MFVISSRSVATPALGLYSAGSHSFEFSYPVEFSRSACRALSSTFLSLAPLQISDNALPAILFGQESRDAGY